MKKTLSLILSLVLALGCTLALVSCGGSDVAGVYEMTDISGTMTSGGVTVDLSKDLYEYYTITLNEDGTGSVKAKGTASGNTSIEQDITWEYEETTLKIISVQSGVNVVEEMTLVDGVIKYNVNQALPGGGNMNMNLTLTKK